MHIVLKGDGVSENGILYGSCAKVILVSPKIDKTGEVINVGLSVIPYNCSYPHYYKHWHRQFTIPGGKKKRIFPIIVPVKEKSLEEFISFTFVLDVQGLAIFSWCPSVPLINELATEPKPYVIQGAYDLGEHYEAIVKRVNNFNKRFYKESSL